MFHKEVSDPTATGQMAQPKPMFIIQNWHRSYAQALLETDPTHRATLIATAERMILDRHVELHDYSIETAEGLDLRQAFQALAELKDANERAEYSPSTRHHSLLIALEAGCR
jgi:hypothetical protein